MMKFICIGDMHGQIPRIKKEGVDFVLSTGDYFPHMGDPKTVESIMRKLIDLNLPIYSTFGNIDDMDYLKRVDKYNENFHLPLGKRVKLNGYHLLDFVDYSHPRLFMMKKVLMDKIKKGMEQDPKKTILLSHRPPKGILDRASDGEHAGDEFLREIVEEYQPSLVVCGHIHEAAGMDELGKTKIINTSQKLASVVIKNSRVKAGFI